LAAWILVFHYLDLYWQVMPVPYPGAAPPDWLDVSVPATLVFAWGAIVAIACQARPLVPVGDARLPESLAFQNT
jgi:hypothetical protein